MKVFKTVIKIGLGFSSMLFFGCNTNINQSLEPMLWNLHNNFKQGPLKASTSKTDWAIDGIGYFTVIDAKSGKKYYTREGAFQKDSQGRIVNKQGYLLDPPLTLSPEQTFSYISEDGKIFISENKSEIPVGQLIIAIFPNPDGLKTLNANKNIFEETQSSGSLIFSPPKTNYAGLIIGGALEDLSAPKSSVPNQGCNKEINGVNSNSNFQKTDKITDWVIDGKGFFRVLDSVTGQFYYTRNGSFILDKDGKMITKHGYYLDPPVQLTPKQSFSRVDDTGKIFIKEENSNQEVQTGQIHIAIFKNPEVLKPLAFSRGSLYLDSNSGNPILNLPKTNGSGFITSGYLENCAVEIIAGPQVL
jgi:flagellar hook protein FlgE